MESAAAPVGPIRRLLVANRGEIAIRVMRAATELGLTTISIYSQEDRLAPHRFKADESYRVGEGKGPVHAYLDIEDVLRIARATHADAIHPGYGFLSENPDFAAACARDGIIFVGPSADVMRRLGNKVEARAVASAADVPVMPATGALPEDPQTWAAAADAIGFPVMLKASWGGGGRGMRVVESAADLRVNVEAGRREAQAAFGNPEVFLEKLVRRALHIEVQILGDHGGTVVHLFERDCSMQRRHQKVVERAPAPSLSDEERAGLAAAALRVARAVGYVGAGTVEFLLDVETRAFYFIEVNPRIQVEHTVTEVVTGIDLVKAQLLVAQGARIGEHPELPAQADITLRGHALQCRITTENPLDGFRPDYGEITAYRSATGFGIRLDGGNGFAGAVITPFYDSLLEKVTAWGRTPAESISRMHRALREFRVRGVATNLVFLEALLEDPRFATADYTTRFIDSTPELFDFTPPRDRASRLLAFLADTIVNGNAEVRGRAIPAHVDEPRVPHIDAPIAPGLRVRLLTMGPSAFARWMREREGVLVTDTTFRDAHQSLLATRVRSRDLVDIADAYARGLGGLFSLECWGGATFDVAMRFLKEDPWDRLRELRARVPNIPLQVLVRGANGVGYTNYPDNVVRFFIEQAAAAGIDVFRVFDSLNWIENMKVSIEAILESGTVCEAAICYTGDLLDPSRPKYDLAYYVDLAKTLEQLGVHIIAIKDMGGLCRPLAARRLFAALREAVSTPLHFHTHDTSGNGVASVLAAIESGADAVDVAMDAMSGLTSQPSFGAILEALRNTPLDTGLDGDVVRRISSYWEDVRLLYAPFESDMRAGTSDVYVNEIPGGQYTNLREQARSLGIAHRWNEITSTYAQVNALFGDIVKVTPTSKCVGDMALSMVTGGITAADVADPARDVTFPESVVEFFRGDIGQPRGGFPAELQRKILGGKPASTDRPGANLAPADLEAQRAAAAAATSSEIDDRALASYLMYPRVFVDFAAHVAKYGDTSVLPTSVFWYGMAIGQELSITIEAGKTLVIRLAAVSEPLDGVRTVFFDLNGQPRTIRIEDRAAPAGSSHAAAKAEDGNPLHVGAPIPGLVSKIFAEPGKPVTRGESLFTIEAMKMETVVQAERTGVVESLVVAPGMQVAAGDLIVKLAPA
jgi:pyruvate carboxylase